MSAINFPDRGDAVAALVLASTRSNGRRLLSQEAAGLLSGKSLPEYPEQRRVAPDLTIRFRGVDYAVPFAEIGQMLLVSQAAGQQEVFAFPDGWNPGISASALPARSHHGMRRAASKPTPPGTGAIARKKRSSSHLVAQGARQATRLARLHNGKPDSAAWAARAIRLLPPPAEHPEHELKSRADKTGTDKRHP